MKEQKRFLELSEFECRLLIKCLTERLKATDQMAWVGKMNSIRNLAKEIVNNELIFM